MQEGYKQVDPGKILQVPFKPYHWLHRIHKSPNFTHLITKYVELEDYDVQEIDPKIEEPISGETLFGEFVEKSSGINKQ